MFFAKDQAKFEGNRSRRAISIAPLDSPRKTSLEQIKKNRKLKINKLRFQDGRCGHVFFRTEPQK